MLKKDSVHSVLARGADNLYANSLEPDQDRQNVGPDLDLNCLALKVFPKKVNFEKQQQQKHEKLASMQRVNILRHVPS